MKTLFLIVTLGLASSSAFADWTPVNVEEDGITQYVSLNSIRRDGTIVEMWDLIDFGNGHDKRAKKFMYQDTLSIKTLSQYDCQEPRMKMLTVMQYDKNMARGKIIDSSYKAEDWQKISPLSDWGRLRTIACKDK